jgi:predicted alpha/beta hydrolase family esterase
MPLRRLPFPSVVVASTDDPYVTTERARRFAEAWGSRFVTVGDAGHINSQSSLGDWPAGFALLQELRKPLTETGPLPVTSIDHWGHDGQ